MNSKDNMNDIEITIAVVMITILSLSLLPMLIMTLPIIMILLYKRVKSTVVVIVTLIITLAINIMDTRIISSFINDYVNIINTIAVEIHTTHSAKNILQTFARICIKLFNYSFRSWIFIANVSILLSVVISNIMNSGLNIKTLSQEAGELAKKKRKGLPKISKSLEIERLNKTPQNMDGKTIIGISGKRIIATSDNAKHIFTCGTTGSGKTVLLANYIESGITKNYPLLIVDGKGDTGENSMLDIVKKLTSGTEKKIYIIDMNNPEESAKYNPFKDTKATVCKDMLINMTNWSEEHYKNNAERYIQRLTQLLNKANITLSFRNILKYMPSDNLSELSMKLSKDGKITKPEHLETLEIIKSSGKIAENAAARFSLIYESELKTIFDDENGVDIYTAIKENGIILFILNPLTYPEVSSLVGKLVLIDAKKAVSNLFTDKYRRKFFIFDEINVYATPTLIDLVNKSRSANVTCVLATQSLADLEYSAGDPFKQQLIENQCQQVKKKVSTISLLIVMEFRLSW